jgi:hypothetical protein
MKFLSKAPHRVAPAQLNFFQTRANPTHLFTRQDIQGLPPNHGRLSTTSHAKNALVPETNQSRIRNCIENSYGFP